MHDFPFVMQNIICFLQDASDETKKSNYEPRIKRHEGRLAALKKGNLLRQTNLDRLIDEINRLRDESVTLQRDLDSVLSELGQILNSLRIFMEQITFVYKKMRFPNMQCDYYENYYSFSFFLQKKIN